MIQTKKQYHREYYIRNILSIKEKNKLRQTETSYSKTYYNDNKIKFKKYFKQSYLKKNLLRIDGEYWYVRRCPPHNFPCQIISIPRIKKKKNLEFNINELFHFY